MFPTIQQNASVITILPRFLEVCGKKLDQSNAVLERPQTCLHATLSYNRSGRSAWRRSRANKPLSSDLSFIFNRIEMYDMRCPPPRFHKQITGHVNTMQDLYAKLEKLQGDIAVSRAARPMSIC